MIIVLLAIIASSLGVLLAAFLSIATDHKPNASITVCIPILVIGILSCLLMTTQGKPLIEWVLPLSVTLLVSRMRRSLRTVTVVAVIETALAAAGVFFFLQVVVINDDYVVVNETILSRDKNLDNVRLSLLQKRIRSELKPGVIYPPQDIREMLHTVDAKCFAHRVYSREWHSSFTRLSKVRLEHRQIWFLGGTVDGEGREVMLEYRRGGTVEVASKPLESLILGGTGGRFGPPVNPLPPARYSDSPHVQHWRVKALASSTRRIW